MSSKGTKPEAARRQSFGESVQNWASKIAERVRPAAGGTDTSSINSLELEKEKARSVSRGRELTSSGRGGAGNIRPSPGRSSSRPADGPDDFSSPTRGRDVPPSAPSSAKIVHVGRGGAGNVRSPERTPRDPHAPVSPPNEEGRARSTGRGGLGNIALREPSADRRSPSAGRARSTGRGGAGNIAVVQQPSELARLEEEDRVRRDAAPPPRADNMHSTGRGGLANVTSKQAPAVERTEHQRVPGYLESAGRGGAGNIRDAVVAQGT